MILNILKNTIAAGLVAAVMLTGMTSAFPGTEVLVANCGKRQDMVKHLGTRYKEQLKALGLVSSSSVMGLYVAETGTWTIILSRPNGVACIVVSGDNWEELPVIPTGPQT